MTTNRLSLAQRAALERIVCAAHAGQQHPPGYKKWVRWYVWRRDGLRAGGTGSDLAAALSRVYGLRITPQLVGLIIRNNNFRVADGHPPEIASRPPL